MKFLKFSTILSGIERKIKMADIRRMMDPCYYAFEPDNDTESGKNASFIPIPLEAQYSGLPQSLIINLITYFVLLLAFCVLRRRAWDYGRIAFLQKSDVRLLNERTSYDAVTRMLYRTDLRRESRPSATVNDTDKGDDHRKSKRDSLTLEFPQTDGVRF